MIAESARLVIRSGTADDATAVEAVHWASRNAAYHHVAGWPPPTPVWADRVELWRQWLTNPEITSLVAEADGVIVGICTVRPATDPDADPREVAEMPTLYVRPDAWSRGFGRALCSEALARASARGFSALTLWSVESNTRAHEFYSAYGFLADGATKVVDWPHEVLTVRRYRIALPH